MSEKTKTWLFVIFFVFSIISFIVIFITAARFNSDNSLTLLANQFAKAHISLPHTDDLPLGDISFYQGKYYLYFGLFGSVILTPAILIFGSSTPQSIIGVVAMIISFVSAFYIARSFKFQKIDSLWLALFFVFSTVLFSASVINISAYQVQALACALLAASVASYFYKKNTFLAGLFLGLAILTRFILIMAVLFFVFEFIQKRMTKQQLILFFVPLLVGIGIFAGYNFVRFNSFLETGYNHLRPAPFPLSHNIAYGAISPVHIPANLYSFLIMPPDPIRADQHGFVLEFPYLRANPWGMAIWFTSPLFLLILFRFKRNKYTFAAAVTSAVLALPAFMYFSVGFAQFGYRYTLDFLPFLFLILIPCLQPKLSKAAIVLVAIGIIFNCIYITSLWDVYPLFGIF